MASYMDEENDIDDEEDENGQEKEEVTLVEMEEDREILVVMDGRRLHVNPGDITTAVLWLPTSTLEVSEKASEKDEGEFFDLSVTLEGRDQQIRARWE
jgi:hypothetical protein